jgi:single-strand DNA-binding protein
MGRLCKDPELTYTANTNTPVARFSLAVDRGYTKQGEEKQTDFINCVAWNKTAEFVSNYFTKGRMAVVVGRIQTRSWDDKDGNKRYATEVVADEIYFGDSKANGTTQQPATNYDEDFSPVEDPERLPF